MVASPLLKKTWNLVILYHSAGAVVYVVSSDLAVCVLFAASLCCTASVFHSNYTSSSSDGDFCHVNNFGPSQTVFHPLSLTCSEELSEEKMHAYMEWGRPFAVSGVTQGWKANEKWSEDYFREVFSNFELFSSTFATNASPVFQSVPQEDVYFGIFLNDAKLSGRLADDYVYPSFIPLPLKMQGTVTSNLNTGEGTDSSFLSRRK